MNELLKKYIDASGYKNKHIADELGLTYPGLYNKLIGKSAFTVTEALQLKRILNITDNDWNKIFDNGTI